MRRLTLAVRLLSVALLSGPATSVFAQAQGDSQRVPTKNESSITGCLNKDASGTYTITHDKTGQQTVVTGATDVDLDKDAANHKVALTGATKADANGKPIFEVTKIHFIATSCKVPSE